MSSAEKINKKHTHTKFQYLIKIISLVKPHCAALLSTPCSHCAFTCIRRKEAFYLVSFQPTDRSIMMTSSVKGCRLTLFHQSIGQAQRCLPNRMGKLCCHSNGSNRKHDNQQTIRRPHRIPSRCSSVQKKPWHIQFTITILYSKDF